MVEVREALEDLPRPLLQSTHVECLVALAVLPQVAACEIFGDSIDAAVALILPALVALRDQCASGNSSVVEVEG
jgi:hypothetical protein